MKIKLLIFVILLLCIDNCNDTAKSPQGTVKGVLDLRNRDFSKKDKVKLDGEWAFYWHEFLTFEQLTNEQNQKKRMYVSVPNAWNNYVINGKENSYFGHATYYIRVLLKKAQQISFKLPVIDTAYVMYINGVKVTSVGTAGTGPESSEPSHKTYVLDYEAKTDVLDIIFHVSNYQMNIGGINCSIYIGEKKAIEMYNNMKVSFEIIIFSFILLMAMYHMSLFLLRRNEKSLLYFALFAFSYAVYAFMMGQSVFNFFPFGISWKAGEMVLFTSLYLTLPMFVLFTYRLFPDEVSQFLVRIIIGCTAVIILMLFIFDIHLGRQTLSAYIILYFLTTFYLLYVYFVARFRKREGARILLIGYIVHMFSLLNDALHHYGYLHTTYLAPAGAYILIACHARLLNIKYIRSFQTIENLSHELEKKNERLLELDQLKDEFLANTSHELRTPLHAISGLTESLMDGSGGKLPDKAYYSLSLIELSSRRLTNLVNDILDFSKLKFKDITLKIVAVNLKSMIDLMFEYFGPLVNNNVQLVNTIDKDFPLVAADECRLQQICFNLLGNAVKFTPSGQISVSANKIFVGEGKKEYVEVILKDTGLGISRQKLETIFTPFEQCCESMSNNFGGTGIGLSIVKKTVELHGGTISASSQPSKGTTFIFTLPVADSKIITQTANREKEIPGNPGTIQSIIKHHFSNLHKTTINKLREKRQRCIVPVQARLLVVEDERINIDVIQNYFYGQPYEIDVALYGAQALQLIDNKKYDLVLLDIMMPDMSGYEVCRYIREKYSNYELPVIMLTAKDSVDDIVNGFDVGTNDYISKPIHKEELLVRVRNHIALHKAVKEHKDAEYKLLQERMNPHFLFNALNTIHALIYTDSELADVALLKLSDIYRYVTDSSNVSVIPFAEEWKFLKNYLDMEKIQFGDSLECFISMEGDFSDIFVPPLSLQPVLENVFKHAFSSLDDVGRVEITAARTGDTVTIIVSDNGRGLRSSVDYSGSLGNIVKRLKYYFIDVSIKIQDKNGNGATTTLIFNLKTGVESNSDREKQI